VGDPSPIVFVIDADVAVCTAIETLLRSVDIVARCFGSADEFLAQLPADIAAPGCVILDVRLPGMSGLELQRELAAHHPSLPVIFITGHGDIATSVRAMKAGALEFLATPYHDQDLLDAVEKCLAHASTSRRTHAELGQLRLRLASLTPREREVMTFVVAGRPNKRIASELGISLVTVKNHRSRVMHKMQAESVADLVRMAERTGVTATSSPTHPKG
jgi:FixJ family two-component response regulator